MLVKTSISFPNEPPFTSFLSYNKSFNPTLDCSLFALLKLEDAIKFSLTNQEVQYIRTPYLLIVALHRKFVYGVMVGPITIIITFRSSTIFLVSSVQMNLNKKNLYFPMLNLIYIKTWLTFAILVTPCFTILYAISFSS